MATQLTAGGRLQTLRARQIQLRVRPRYLAGGAMAVLFVAYLSAAATITNAHREQSSADARYENTRALIDVPVSDIAVLQTQVATTNKAVATAEALVAPSELNLDSDDATALLVRRAQDAGLAVRGIDRVAASAPKIQGVTYDQTALRMTVVGSPRTLAGFLAYLDVTHSTVVPSLSSLELNGDGSVAIIVFSAYSAAATPAASATPGARR